MFGKHITILELSYDPIEGREFYKSILEIDGKWEEQKRIIKHYVSEYYILEDGEISKEYNSLNKYYQFDNTLEIR
jgi:hypothetical protein